MMEILAERLESAIEELGISAIKTYQGQEYQVWELTESEFAKLESISDEDWKDDYGMWRYAKGSNMTNPISEYTINEQIIRAWDGSGRLEALQEVDGDEDSDDYCYLDKSYKDLLEYFCEEIGASQPKNICALAIDLAKVNSVSLAELFSKYQG